MCSQFTGCFLTDMMFIILFSLAPQASLHPLGLLHDSASPSNLLHGSEGVHRTIQSPSRFKLDFAVPLCSPSRQSLLQGLRSDFVKYHAQWLASAVITVRVQRRGMKRGSAWPLNLHNEKGLQAYSWQIFCWSRSRMTTWLFDDPY